jgi:hypothetical protein
MENMKAGASHRVTVDAEAKQAILESQAEDIVMLRKLYSSQLEALKRDCGGAGVVDDLETLLDPSNYEMNSKHRQDQLNAVYRKVISLPDRIKAAKKLIDMLEKLIRMEREAYGLDQPEPPQKGIEEVLSELGKKIRAHIAENERAEKEQQDSVADAPPVEGQDRKGSNGTCTTIEQPIDEVAGQS